MLKKKLAVLFGGKSAEHEISIRSANNIINNIDKDKYEIILIGIDKQGRWFTNLDNSRYLDTQEDLRLDGFDQEVAICLDGTSRFCHIESQTYISVDIVHPVLHGPFGEDGSIQGLLKIAEMPYVGPDVLGSAVGMDKVIMKRILRDAGIKVGPYLSFLKEESRPTFDFINEQLSMPVFVKPANMGSSIGINKVYNEEQLSKAMEDAFQYDRKIIIEANISGREIECAVIGNEFPKASLVGEVVVHDDFYAYDTKYNNEDGASIRIPANVSDEILQKTQEIAIRTFKALSCEGLGRVDVFVKDNGEIFVSEINTIPGFTSISMYPVLWKESGMNYTSLLNELYRLAEARYERESKLL